jgi:hypothetical protein
VILIAAQIFFRLRGMRRDKAAAVIDQSLSSHHLQQAE